MTGTETAAPPVSELVAFGLAMEEAHKALAAALRRAETAETELSELAGRIGAVIAAAGTIERRRAEAAEAKIAEAREGIGNFLGEYGDSEIPVFKVAQDLANSLRKVLDGRGEGPG